MSGSQMGVEGRDPRASVLFSNHLGVEDGASVYLFVKTKGHGQACPSSPPFGLPSCFKWK